MAAVTAPFLLSSHAAAVAGSGRLEHGQRDADATTTTHASISSSELCMCHCQRSTSPLLAEIKRASKGLPLGTVAGYASSESSDEERGVRGVRGGGQQVDTPSSSSSGGMLPLDEALVLGRRLTLQWERINGCLNVDEHLAFSRRRRQDDDDTAGSTNTATTPTKGNSTVTGTSSLVASMARAVERLLSIYEVALDKSIAPAPEALAPAAGAGTVRTCLGPLELAGEEAAIVAQEALRHMIARLGDVLKDIEEEVTFATSATTAGTGTGPGAAPSRVEMGVEMAAAVGVTVKRAQGLMFRLLGRVPR